jgi:predicted RNase H-like HicB family nuclease
MPWTIDDKVEWLLTLPWQIRVEQEDDGSLFAQVEQLAGAVADGATPEALDASFWMSLRETLRAYLEAGDPIPLPVAVTPPWEQAIRPPFRHLRARLSIGGVVTDMPTPFAGGLAIA